MNTFREDQSTGVSEGENGENMRNLRALSYKKGLAGTPGRVGIWALIWLQESS